MKNIFISSTFIDMQAERDLVQERVLPALRDEARKYGDNVGVIDLRWGVDTSTLETEEGAAKVLKVCLDEIDRSHPYMLIFLGERYGTMMREDQIEKSVRGREDKYTTDDYVKSITALEVEYGALSERYGELNHCVVCFREPVVHMLDGAEKDLYAEHTDEGKRKLEALKERIKRDLGDDDRLITYSCAWDKSARQLVDFASNGQPLENVLTNCFAEMFRDDWKEYENLSWQDKEQLAFRALMESKLRSFVGREALLEEYYQSAVNGTCPIILQGEVGSGKTAIMCKLVERLQKEGKNVFAFFAGAGSMSTTAELLLQQMVYYMESLVGVDERYCGKSDASIDLIGEVDQTGMLEQTDILETDDEYDRMLDLSESDKKTYEYLQWLEYLNNLCCRVSDEKVYLCIDALELLERDEHVECLDFALKNEKVQVVLTCVDGYSLPEEGITIEEIPRLSEKDAKGVLEGVLASYSRNTYDSVEQKILSKENIGNPLYISLLIQRLNMMDAEELGELKTEKEIIEYVEEVVVGMPEQLDVAIRTIIEYAIKRIDGDEKFLWEMVRYIAVSRTGLRSQDLQMICNDIGMEFQELDFLRLKKYLDVFFYVSEDDSVDFMNRLIRQSVLENINDVCTYEEQIVRCIQKLDKEDTFRIHEGMYYARLQKNTLLARELITQAYETKNKELLNVIKREAFEDGGEFYCEVVLEERELSSEICGFFELMASYWDEKEKTVMIKQKILTAIVARLEERYQVDGTTESLEKLCSVWYCLKTVYFRTGQKRKAQSLREKLREGYMTIYERKPDGIISISLGVECLEMGDECWRDGDWKEALKWFNKGLGFSKKACEQEGKASWYDVLCWICYRMWNAFHLLGSTNEGDFWLEKEMEYAKRLNEKNQGEVALACLSKAYEHKAKALVLKGNTSEAMEFYECCRTVREKMCNRYPTKCNMERLICLYRHIGSACEKMSERERGFSYYELSIEVGKKLFKKSQIANDYGGMAFALKTMGVSSYFMGKNKDAESYYSQGIMWMECYFSLMKDVNTLEVLASHYLLAAMYYEEIVDMEGDEATKQAMKLYLKYADCYEKIYKELKDEARLRDLVDSYTRIGNIIRKMGGRIYLTQYDTYATECLEKRYSMYGKEQTFLALMKQYRYSIKLLKVEKKVESILNTHDLLIGVCEDFYEKSAIEKYRDVLAEVYYEKGLILYELKRKDALIWFEKAADLEYPHANHAIGKLYSEGVLVPRDIKKTVEYYERAIEQRDSSAMNDLGVMYAIGEKVPRDIKKAIAYFEKAAECGDDKAKQSLAFYYMKGKGIKKDIARAIELYTELAEKGDVGAQFRLASVHMKGKGVKKDMSVAAKWLACATEQGDSDAQFLLGMLYLRGKGVEKNQELAYDLFSKAAKGGHSKAIRLMKMISR